MPSEHASAELLGALSKLLTEVRAVDLPLRTPGAQAVEETRGAVVDQLSDYVIPRLVQLEAPLLTVVGGSTGAGKSTLVNTLVGSRVTESGVLRPTTRSPVLVHHPDDAEWFQPDRILPDLPRTDVPTNDVYALRLAASTGVPRGLAILDAPDVDSIDADNRALATQLLAAADLWLFVTSAARYADQVPWDYLRRAAERSTSVAVVLDRTSAEAVVEVRGHLARMMTARGLSDSPLFTVPEAPIDPDGLIPAEAVAPITRWLHDLAADPEARQAVVLKTLDGAVRHNVMRTHDVADELGEQVTAAGELRADLDEIYDEALDVVERSSADGSLLRGDVRTRWQEFVGTGELLRSVEEKVSRLRDRLLTGVTGRRTRDAEVAESIAQALVALVLESVQSAGEAVVRGWGGTDVGRPLVDAHRGVERPPADLAVRVERLVHDWQARVVELVRTESADRKLNPNVLALGQHGVAVAVQVMVLVQRSRDDLDAAEAARSLLTAIFGAGGAKQLLDRAHDDLVRSAGVVVEAERQRFGALVPDPDRVLAAQTSLREAARQAEYARHADFLDGELSR
ncbi:MAG: ABC transporter [Aeromicrobium erythreum]